MMLSIEAAAPVRRDDGQNPAAPRFCGGLANLLRFFGREEALPGSEQTEICRAMSRALSPDRFYSKTIKTNVQGDDKHKN